jgi:thiol-disulfide isomerase/thioredoxin
MNEAVFIYLRSTYAGRSDAIMKEGSEASKRPFFIDCKHINAGTFLRKESAMTLRYFACLLLFLIGPNAYAIELLLSFPHREACGLVTACHPPQQVDGSMQRARHARVIAHALGKVTVADDEWVLLELRADSESQRAAIRLLPTNGIRGLRIISGMLDRLTLAHVCRMTSLEVLDLRSCRLDEGVFRDQPGLPRLKDFVIYADTSDQTRGEMAGWMRGCPQLEYAYCRHELSLTQWEQLADHPKLDFVNVAIGHDAVGVLRTLETLKRLRGLNLKVSPDANPAFVEILSRLKGVEWINWSGGRFGEREARSLAKMKGLKSLVLQGGVELPEDLLHGLSELDQLQRLVINTSNILYEPSNLLPVLARMPALQHWPLLDSMDSRNFMQLARRNDIVSLQLSSIDPGVDREQLKSFLGTLRLKRLFLHDEELDGLDFLAKQDELQMLRLHVRGVDGDQLSVLSPLPNLKELHIHVGGAEHLSYAPLAKCPALEALYINGEMMAARDLASLSQSSSIRSVSIESGYVDDANADWLSQAKGIRDISLGRDCMLTDAGLSALSRNQMIESLDVGGLISGEGAELLSSLRRLRRLVLRSPLLTPADQKSLKARLAHVPSVSFPQFDPLRGPWEKGADGFLRITDRDARALSAELEGQPAPDLSGRIVSKDGAVVKLVELRGKVVIVDFWGVWCEPCINMMPLLTDLEEKYRENGLCVVGVHSQKGAEEVNAYLRSHPKEWPNIIDSDGALAEAYRVKTWPSLYIIDKEGRVRVALPHVLGLEAAVTRLISE